MARSISKGKIERSAGVHRLQNVVIHKARAEPEVRERRTLVGWLIEMGARVKNPVIYASDRR